VDLVRFSPGSPDSALQKRLGIEESDKVLLFMGTVFRFSGLYELLTELSNSMRRDPSIKLLILGDGEDLPRIQQLASSLNIAKQVPTPGRIDYKELVDHLRLGTVAILPFKVSLLTHCALPNKVLQYLACGLPTIATRLEGLASMLPNQSGLVYTSTTSEMAITAMQLLNQPRSLSSMSSLGRQDMAKLCDWSRQLDIFETLLTSHGRAGK
jgi:glycosyltransferase involved in cell wall biosynthesis